MPPRPSVLLMAVVGLIVPLLAGASPLDEALKKRRAPLEYQASDPSAPVVTSKNLMTSERFWPLKVALKVERPPADGVRRIRKGAQGVLIRVNSDGRARIDFGRQGIALVPVDQTDLIARANEIRLGQREKDAPIFTWAIGPRLVDPAKIVADAPPEPVEIETLLERRGYLVVFIDPGDEQRYAQIADALSPLHQRNGVETVVFAKGRLPDGRIAALQNENDWKALFVISYLSDPYAKTLLPKGAEAPYLMLISTDGRIVESGPWESAMSDRLARAIDLEFAPEANSRSAAR